MNTLSKKISHEKQEFDLLNVNEQCFVQSYTPVTIKKKKTKMPIFEKLTLKRHSHARMIFLNKAKVSIQL